jgi:hypothetical protein
MPNYIRPMQKIARARIEQAAYLFARLEKNDAD